jgi:FMN phosphatase YigB (HAD superfamily)
MDDIVFLFDVDNTLLDNDALQEDLSARLLTIFGPQMRDRYWALFEVLREASGYADYLGALERLRAENLRDRRLLALSGWLIDYPFASRLYPQALDAARHVGQWGRIVVLSDGDAVFQPRKVERSGIGAAFNGEVLIYIHKQQELDDVEKLYPARRYVLVDDKLRILTDVKAVWKERLTTVFPRQGHYARDPAILAACPPADIEIARIGELTSFDLSAFDGASRG